MTAQRFLKSGHHPDYLLLAIVVMLTIIGLVILASASSDLGKIKFNDSYYYLKHQATSGLVVGFVGFLIAYFIHYQRFRRFALFILLLNLVFLGLVFTSFGVKAGGASRWIQLGPIGFQPAELLKISYIIYIAAWLANPKINRTKDLILGLVPFFIISSVVAIMLLAQPSTRVVVILLSAGIVIYFMSGASFRHLGLIMIIGMALGGIVLFASYQGWISKYRWQRIETFLDHGSDSQASGFQITQALIAIGSGQVTGTGYGQSTTKINRLPGPIDDSIFAVAAQELGFIGAGGLVALSASWCSAYYGSRVIYAIVSAHFSSSVLQPSSRSNPSSIWERSLGLFP